MKNKIIYIFLFIGLSTLLYSQSPNFVKKQFTIEDGLPSNESHDIVQDAKGYMWFATDRGLVRYDGYEFKTYGIQKGLKDISCLKLFLDKNDNIWIMTLSKSIYIYRQENDKIEKYKYDDKLNIYAQLSRYVADIYVTKDLTLFITFNSVTTVSIDKLGEVCEYSSDNPYIGLQITPIEDYFMLGDDAFDENLKIKPLENKIRKFNHGYLNDLRITYNGIKHEIPYNEKWNGTHIRKCYLLKNGKLLISIQKVHFIIEENKITFYKNGDGFNHLFENENHEIFTAQINKVGVKYFRDSDHLLNNEFSYILKNISASKLFFDIDNNLWISTLEDGIFFLKRSLIEPIHTFANIPKVSEVEITNEGNLYFVENDVILGQYSLNSKLSKILKKYPLKIYNLFYDQVLNKLFTATLSSEYLKNGVWENMYCTIFSRKIKLSSKNIKRLDKNTIVSSLIQEFNLYKGDAIVEEFNSNNEGINKGLRINDITTYNKSSLLLGTAQGLYLFEDGKYKSLDSIFPIFSTRINKILHHKDGYLLGSQGNGVLFWDGNNKMQKYSKSDGLLSDVIENIKINTNGQIYLATYSGMSIMVPVDTGYQIKNYTTAHGLPSNEVFDIDYFGDVLYVATGKGLCKLNISTTINQISKSPILEGIYVNNIKYDINNRANTLTYDQNNLKINYKTID